MEPSIKILVTGVTGFLGSHVAAQLLEKGYKVRGTVRDLKNPKKIEPLSKLPRRENLELVEADLLKPETIDAAVKDCTLVMHVASPFPANIPKNEQMVIKPAVEGTLSVLKACTKYHVKKVVITSSEAAIMSLGKNPKKDLTEEDWADIRTIPPYNKSKTLAEKAAWEYYGQQPKESRFEMATINPGLILGPAMVSTDFTSGEIIKQLLMGEAFAMPRVQFGIVDVRDVARSHVLAMENPKSDGQRYICNSDEHLWFEEIGAILKEEYAKYGYKITTRKIKYCTAKIASFFSAGAKSIVPFWGKEFIFHNEKIKTQLGMKFCTAKESVLAMANSLIENGVVPNKIKKEEVKSPKKK